MKLTKPQQLVYDMERFSGGAIATICGSFLIDGQIDVGDFKAAVNKLYEINDALRIRITEENGIAQQEITPYSEKDVQILFFINNDEFEAYADKLAQEPMDIYGELATINGVVVGGKYGAIVKIHHIISDAWTLSIIGTQLIALLNGEDVEAFSYSDYVKTEAEYLVGKRFAKDKTFWLDTFKKCDEPTYLSDVITKNISSKRQTFIVDKEKTKIISDFATSTESSMYFVLMTAVSVYFNRVKNNVEKFYIGTAVLNRNSYEEKKTMGMFINTVPILIELDNDKTFEENMENINTSSMAAFRHQRFNYGDILKTVRERYKFDEKLYDVIFSFQNAKIAGEDAHSQWYHCGSQNESLQIHINDRDDEGILKVHYDYNIEKFSDLSIQRMHSHIFNLLFDAIENYQN